MCQVHTGAYVSLLTPEETEPLATQGRLPRIYYAYQVVSITTHTHDRRKSIGENEQIEEKNEGKERKEKRRE